jgi:type I restriction enzyme S subunit
MNASERPWPELAMAGEWPTVEIGTVANIFDGPHATPPTVDHGPIFLGIDSLDHGRLDLSETRHVSENTFAEWTRRVVPAAGDLVFSYETRIGQAALIPEGLRCCLGRRLALARPSTDALNSYYLLYYYLSPSFQAHLRAHTMPGSTVDRIHLKNFPKFPIVLPPRRYQDQIAELLGALDSKIELNRRMIKALEATARALFKSWFVDFDPVLAKAEARSTGLSDDLAAQFPDRLSESGLPVGWKRTRLGEVIELAYGKSLTAENRRPGAVPVYGSNGQVGFHDTALVEGPGIVVGRKGNPGTVTYVSKSFFPIDTTFYVVPRNQAPMPYLWFLLQGASLEKHSADSAVPGLNREAAYSVEIITPPEYPAANFATIASSLIERAEAARTEAKTLADLRDTLLPKLISGELRIADAENHIAVA